jgi:dienelactone hydrolase
LATGLVVDDSIVVLESIAKARERGLGILESVVTGANDPRVPASEADQIIAAVRAQGGEAWHLLGQNEGHGFAKKENADYQFWASLMFWKQTLLAE